LLAIDQSIPTWKKPRVEHPYQHPQHSNLRKVFDTSKPNRQDPPATQQERQPARRADVAFHDVVGGDFEEGVGGCEQGDCDGVLVVGHVRLLEEGVACFRVEEFGVADVAFVRITRVSMDDAFVLS
jgi:hypothetical protein